MDDPSKGPQWIKRDVSEFNRSKIKLKILKYFNLKLSNSKLSSNKSADADHSVSLKSVSPWTWPTS